MLFRPSPDQNPAAVQALLDAWNAEADDLRRIAREARATGQAMSSTVVAAEDISKELGSLLEELDRALGTVPSGSRLFTDLLQAQVKAIALHESVGKTLDLLADCAKVEVRGPTTLGGQAAPDDHLSSIDLRQAA